MIQTTIYSAAKVPDTSRQEHIIQFLHTHLEQYGDHPDDIRKAFDYAMANGGSPGGFVITAESEDGELLGAALVNKTGMKGYIPENILVYIATHGQRRGMGIGTALMEKIVEETEGDLALHVEHDNPARALYERFGFTNKYLEMRLNKKTHLNGLSHA
jgi:GNAT superfamily N-acetyltransferase